MLAGAVGTIAVGLVVAVLPLGAAAPAAALLIPGAGAAVVGLPLLAASVAGVVGVVAGVVAAGVTPGIAAAVGGVPVLVAGASLVPPQAAARLTSQQQAALCSCRLRRGWV
jgi:hypothetical protein